MSEKAGTDMMADLGKCTRYEEKKGVWMVMVF